MWREVQKRTLIISTRRKMNNQNASDGEDESEK
jgi:hypothetical protein